MKTLEEIQAAILKLSESELKDLNQWFEEHYEDQLELTSAVEAKLDQARAEIRRGDFVIRRSTRG
jgi:hypothetical protein